MATKDDINHTINQIRNFWPDLEFVKEDIVHGKLDFIIKFFTNFVLEVNEKISTLSNRETIGGLEEDSEFARQITLYCKVAMIFRKFTMTLNLADLFVPNPKKMYPFIKLSIHFVIYLDNCLDKLLSVVNESFKMIVENEEMKIQKQKILQDSAESSENIGREKQKSEFLKVELDEVKQRHEKMLMDKAREENVLSEKTTEVNLLQNEVANLEYELNLLEDKEAELKECVITETDFEHLKATEKYLQKEQKQLCNDECITVDNIDKELESVKTSEAIVKNLEGLKMDSLEVATLRKLREQDILNKSILKKLVEELVSLKSAIELQMNVLQAIKKDLNETRAFSEATQKKISEATKKAQAVLTTTSAECAAKFKEHQKLKTKKIELEKDLLDIEENEQELKDVVAEEYREVLNREREATNKFHQVLSNLNDVDKYM